VSKHHHEEKAIQAPKSTNGGKEAKWVSALVKVVSKERPYEPKTYFVRDKIILPAAIKILGPVVVKVFDFHGTPYKVKRTPFLLLGNHNDVMDPGYEMIALNRPMRFVASDHVVRDGFFGAFLKFFGNPIVKYRDRPGSALVEDILATLKAGIPVGIEVEGGTSFNGETRYISPNTAKMVKDAGVDVLFFRCHGGYMRSPRWCMERRTGPLFGGVSEVLTKEQIAEMTVDEIYDAICKGLYVNAYEEQRKNPQTYHADNLAEACEIVTFQCPVCHQVGTLHSKGNFLTCDCGYQLEMKDDGFFHDCGHGVIYDNIVDWDHWQKEAVKEYIDGFKDKPDQPIFHDEKQIVTRVDENEKTRICEDGVLELYYDRVELHGTGIDWSAPISDVTKMDYMRRQSLFVITDDVYYDLDAPELPRSPLKYLYAWRYLTGRPNY